MADPTGSPEVDPAPPTGDAPAIEAQAPETRGGQSLWHRIQEHKVVQWTLAYAAMAYTLLHGTEMVSEALEWPHLIVRIFTLLLLVGVPVVVTLAWYHGAKALKRVSGPELTIIMILLFIAGSILWALNRTGGEHGGADASRTAQKGEEHSASPAITQSSPSLAVLPFADLSPDHDQEYFSDGLAEELLNQLAKVPGLKVIGRTSSFAFKGKNEDLITIGKTLGVNHVLEGSVRKDGNKVRITAQLISAADGSHLWSNTYDRDLDDVFAIQEEIAKKVTGTLRVSIGALDLSEGGTKNFAAYDAYLSGIAFQFQAGRGDSLNSISRLERAVGIDPNFAVAWVALTQSYQEARLGYPERSSAWREKWIQAGDRIVALAPDSAAATLVAADRAIEKKDLVEAGRLFQTLANLPAGINAQAQFRNCLFLSSVAHAREAIDCWERLVAFEPFAVLPSVQLEAAYDVISDVPHVTAEHQRVASFAADNFFVHASMLTRAMEARDQASVRQELRTLVALGPATPGVLDAERLLGSPDAARQELHRAYDDPKLAGDTIGLSAFADWAAFAGDPELALSALRKTYIPANGPDITQVWAIWRPLFKDTRRLPGFKDFVRELGLVDYWRATNGWGEFCKPSGTEDFDCH